MANTQEKIAKLEQDASTLVKNLEELYKKAGNYNVAKEELQKTNTELVKLIKETKTIGEQSHRTILLLNEIGASQIFYKLDKLKNAVLLAIILLILTLVLSIIIYLK